MAILKTTFTLMMMMAWMAMTSVVTSFAPLRPVIRPSAGAATASTISTSSQLQVSPMNLRFVSFIFGLVWLWKLARRLSISHPMPPLPPT